MASVKEILARIDEKAPYSMVLEASVRDYCVLALQFLREEADFSRYFESSLPNPFPGMEKELQEQRHARERYCVQLYAPSEEALLADAIADLAFAQSQRLTLAYTLFALALHSRTDFAVLFLEAWDNFNEFASARTIRKHYDRSWNSRYDPLFYPLG